ncbi:RNA polymerase sigma-I factor [Thermobrachium celere]|uniref:RNA polymerase sigma-I factor n=1 Tax=Thermobrachium celere TaxID=53422 RepID=UPI00194513D7|nr:RNA polymerase sigma-I factor [Thermobrachium celere]GFR36504.1 RNA polymerase sigma factor SigI [Thermobrachium celere]
MITDREQFIESNRDFIYKVASSICKRRLNWENDDELSIALIAFNKSIDTYNKQKGNFFSYAKMVIKNSLIDYFRKSTKNLNISLDDEDLISFEHRSSIERYEIEEENKIRTQEITLFSLKLKEYGISFSDLVSNSPKHKDTREELINVAFLVSKESQIIEKLTRTKQLPIKQICLLASKNEKFIEKWRRYLIALILILTDEDLKYIRSYLNIKVGEIND